jgi:excinuclease UvrABC nuclease subunit
VYALEVAGQVTHLSSAPNLHRRLTRTLERLLAGTAASQSQGVRLHAWPVASKLHGTLLLYELAKLHFSGDYLQRIRLRMPWFVALLNRDRFPRLTVADRLPAGGDPIVGPFLTRSLAQLYQQALEDRFLIRRCTEVLAPDPNHPGCIYGEIKHCLRPCQCAVSDDRYRSESAQVSVLLRDSGGKAARELAKLRDRAVADLDFEAAATIHKSLEECKGVNAFRDPVVNNLATFGGFAVVPCTRPSTAAQIFPLVQGHWCNPVTFEPAAVSADSVNAALNPDRWEVEADGRDALEDVALFARWYYSTWREGIWVPCPNWANPPWKKIWKALDKLLKPQIGSH